MAQGLSRRGGANPLILQGFSRMQPLEPGTYEGLVVDVDERPDGGVALEIAITSGDHKGDTVQIRGPRMKREPLEILGLPVTLDVTVEGIRVHIENG
jgi:hypothetical protein